MKQLRKCWAVLLVVCLLLSVAVPVAHAGEAADEPEVYTYSLGSGTDIKYDISHSSKSGWSGYTQVPQNQKLQINENFAYLNQSATNSGTYADTSIKYPNRMWTESINFTAAFYGQADVDAGQWIAFSLKIPKAGIYEMAFKTGGAGLGGLVKTYVLEKSKYDDVIKDYTLDATSVLTKEQNDAIYKALADKNAVLNDESTAVLDCSNKAEKQLQSIGNVRFEKSGEYVLMFRLVGRNEATEVNACRLALYSVSMTLLEEIAEPLESFTYSLGSGTDIKYDISHSSKSGWSGYTQVPQNQKLQINENFAYLNQSATNSGTYADTSIKYPNRMWTESINFTAAFYGQADVDAGQWIAFSLKIPKAGIYEMAFKTGGASQGGLVKTYVLEKSKYDDVIKDYTLNDTSVLTKEQNDAIYKALEESGAILNDESKGVLDCSNKAEKQLQSIGSVQFDSRGDYVLLFRIVGRNEAAEAGAYRLVLYSVMMDLMKALEDSGHEPEDPDQPADPENPGTQVEMVDAEVVADDAVRTGTYAIAGTSVVNGHDYLYLFMQGEKLLVYDLDTKQKVDMQTNSFNTPRAMVTDSHGIVWVVGASNFLYRYDPFKKEGTRIKFPSGTFQYDGSFNGQGITVDKNDVLYFGTYNRAYFGMYAPYSESPQITRISDWLNSSTTLEPDSIYAGRGGVIEKDGYLYAGIDGDKNGDLKTTHQIIKYSIAEQKIVQSIDLDEYWLSGTYLHFLSLVDGVLLAGPANMLGKTIAIDITGEKMKEIDIPGMDVGFCGFVSAPIDGKAYCVGNSKQNEGLFAYDIATRTAQQVDTEKFPAGMQYLLCWNGSVVTIEGDDRLPGKSLITVVNNTVNGTMEPVFYNPQTKETVTWESFTLGEGSGNALRGQVTDPEGKNVYVGSYGSNVIAQYNVESGEVTKLIPSYDHQTDTLMWYDGYLYAANYQQCTITQVDVQTGKIQPFFALKNTVFCQYRMHSLAAGDGKLFGGTVPGTGGYGGVLVWYDLEEKLTYVAAGPDPEDVYYADTSVAASEYVWYNAVTKEAVNFDDNGDGVDDVNIKVDGKDVPRFTGTIANQTINCIVYSDGYIFGTASKHGGSGTIVDRYDGNATLFVYDVAAKKVIATCDLCDVIEGLATPVNVIDVIEKDPQIPGKFWGVVYDTLFSFTFDAENKQILVKEELSLGKAKVSSGACDWNHRNIVFDEGFMYVIFGNRGVYMIDRADPKNYVQLSKEIPYNMVMAADNNLYITDNHPDLEVLRIAPVTASIKDQTAADAVVAKIDAIGTVTAESEAAITAARSAYNALTDTRKVLVSNLDVLVAAEEAYKEIIRDPSNPGTGDGMDLAVFGGILLASTAVLAVLLTGYDRKKRV